MPKRAETEEGSITVRKLPYEEAAQIIAAAARGEGITARQIGNEALVWNPKKGRWDVAGANEGGTPWAVPDPDLLAKLARQKE